jgi:phenylpropionate dioxygenase-like ring-hydroxylating dioxygenase large terminal subunit
MSEHDPAPMVRRSRGISYQHLLDRDSRPVPDHLRIDTAAHLGDHDIPIDRYIDPAFHALEKERLWPKVWQMAVREERIPEVGDTELYEINDISILIVRTAPDEIKGFYNACLHMGRRLVDRPCRLNELRCPYHGFAWQMNGKLKQIPGMWDFPQVKPREFQLPEVQVARWNGFVFINMNPDCVPFAEWIGEIAGHWAKYPLEDRYSAVHVRKVLRCNWKVAQEAYMDAYHVVATHPQILVSAGDDNSQYDVFGHCSRAMTAAGVASPHLDWTPTEDEIAAHVYRPRDNGQVMAVPEGMTYREYGAGLVREQLREVIGDKADALCDAEVLDSFYYTVFPNFHPWLAYNQVVQNFRPWQDRHDLSVMDLIYLRPFTGERPPPAEVHFLDADQSFLEAPEMGIAAALQCQDAFNVEAVQRGLHSLRRSKDGITLGLYQHSQVRHFHNLYDRWLGAASAGRAGRTPGPEPENASPCGPALPSHP